MALGSSVIASGASRSQLQVTLGVWRALILREAEAKLFASRVSWIWVLVEPVFHVLYLMVLYSVIRVHKVGELDTAIWVMVGLQAYFIFRKTADGVANVANDNSALFAYRQVKPIDTLIARALLEATMSVVTWLLLIALVEVWGHPFQPDYPLEMLGALAGMWLFGFGFGMIVSALTSLVRELKLLLQIVLRPLYLVSGVIFPISSLSQPIRQVLMLNPIAHGVEMARSAISRSYDAVPETDPTYLFAWAGVTVFLGLALQIRFAFRIAER
ncbi:ABC transporter permease [Novosphingobium huizhouense]|uniref:ABC transporter permease n=1 Tax=Novosphingobium huizhouense TaxID=2866625 RepID=UPI001CD8E7A4|nr:ABC transporter permease [Novosphingobium huizhouense]